MPKGRPRSGVYWEAVAEFKRQLEARQSGEVDVFAGTRASNGGGGNGAYESGDGWTIIDGDRQVLRRIIAALTSEIERDRLHFIEVIIPDALNAYDVLVWAEKGSHSVLTQRKDETDRRG